VGATLDYLIPWTYDQESDITTLTCDNNPGFANFDANSNTLRIRPLAGD
jgi:hypothetical protein